MAIYQFSALSDGQAITFNPTADVLNFDQAAIGGADVRAVAEGANLRVSVGTKDVLLTNVALAQIAQTNVTFADGSRFLIGDNTTGTANDNAANSLTGTTGRDFLAGLGGADTLNGGAGNDTYLVTAGDVLSDSGGIDTVIADASWSLGSAFENIVYQGSANTSSAGNSLANGMTGNAGANFLDGRENNDTLSGMGGADTLKGGAGADTFLFASAPAAGNADTVQDFVSGTDKVVLDGTVHASSGASGGFIAGDARFWSSTSGTAHDADDRVTYNTSTGQLWYDADGSGSGAAQLIATLTGAPSLSATDIAVVNGSGTGGPGGGSGTAGNDSITGTAGNDSLSGLAGNDTLEGLAGDDTLDGGTGVDSMVGGAGSDTYFVDNSGDVIVELDNGGIDSVNSSVNYTLADWVNNLTLTGTTALVGSGNELDNVLIGNSAGNFLEGGEGNDTINGGAGNDVIHLTSQVSGFRQNPGNDSIDGGDGTDGVAFLFGDASTTDDATVDLVAGTYSISGENGTASGTLTSIENVLGSWFEDHITGSDAVNAISGAFGNDTLLGLGGNDSLAGNEGDDLLDGGAGNDSLTGGDDLDDFMFTVAPGAVNADLITDFSSSVDTIVLDGAAHAGSGPSGDFSAGDARFWSSATGIAHDADDRVLYDTGTGELWYDADGNGAGARQLVATLQAAPTLAATDIAIVNGSGGGGGTGQHIVGTAGNDSLVGGSGDDTIEGLAGNDTLAGAGGNDSLVGGEGVDSILGGDGNDTLDGRAGSGDDTLDGGLGDDTYFTSSPQTIVDAGGHDTVITRDTNYALSAGIEDLTFSSGMFDAVGTGNELNNVIRNASSAFGHLDGGDGDDTLIGGVGSSNEFQFFAGSGNIGNDVVDGGGGPGGRGFLDVGFFSGVVADFRTGLVTGGGNGGSGSVRFTNIQEIFSGSFDDHLIADDGGRTLNAWEGNDTLDGGAGTDSLTAGAGNDILAGGAGFDTLTGGAGADQFLFNVAPGAVNADRISDFASGTDKIVLDGNFHLGAGASGNFGAGDGRFYAAAGAAGGHDADDRVIYDTASGQLWYDADGSGSGAAQRIGTLTGAPTLTASDLAIVNGSGGGGGTGQHIVGTSGNDSLAGGPGDDTIEGLAGNDTLDGGAGNNVLLGGDGNDTIIRSSVSDTVDGGAGVDTEIFRSGVAGTGIENVILRGYSASGGSDGHGNELDNVITDEGPGNAWLYGNAGDDTLIGGNGFNFFDFNVFPADGGVNDYGQDSVDGGGDDDWLMFENVASAVTVDFRNGTASGGGAAGNGVTFVNVERAQGSLFNDVMFAGGGGNWLNGYAGNDTLTGGAGDDQLGGDSGFGHPTGNPGDDRLSGGAGNDGLGGEEGNDWLDGGTGNDELFGGSGADTFVFAAASGAANADGIGDFASGSDKIQLDGTVHANTGASGNFAAGDARFWSSTTGTAHDADDRVLYNTTNGQLWYDADGNGAGARQLIATLQGAPALAATDIAIVNGSGTGGGGGTITGTSGNDSLTGTAGNDTIDGLGGVDTMNGMAGDDTYFVTAGDVIQDSGGVDSIFATASYALPTGIENITYTGMAGTSSVGNLLDNVMTGNSGANYMEGRGANDTLIGNAGNDTLHGGVGLDMLTGGAGLDSFRFAAAPGSANADVVTDFVSGTDKLQFDDAFHAGIGALGNFAAGDGRFWAAAGATSGHDANDRIVYNSSTGALYYDADGSGAGAAQLVATIQGHPAVGATDIAVI